MSKVWEPIGYIGFVENTLLYTNDHGDAIQRLSIGTGAPHEVVLPDNVRLCRLVDAPDAANAQPVQPTAQAFYDEWIRRYMDASKQRGDPYQIARDIAIELGIKETHDA